MKIKRRPLCTTSSRGGRNSYSLSLRNASQALWQSIKNIVIPAQAGIQKYLTGKSLRNSSTVFIKKIYLIPSFPFQLHYSL